MAMKHERTHQIDGQSQGASEVPAGGGSQGRTIQSVDRALQVLEAISNSYDGMTVTAVSEKVGLNVSTCHHLLTTLAYRGYLTQISRGRGYTLGPKLSELIDASERELDPAILLENDLRDLGVRLGHGVQFAVLSDTSLLTKLSFASETDSVREPSEVEKMTALHATATGKAILAWIPDTELVRVISANGLTAYTPQTITTLSGLVDELRVVRRGKFSVDDEEFHEGIVCIGATIREGAGAVIGSISTTVSAGRATEEYRQYLAKEMITAANRFSSKLRDLKS